jgi:hypothetical protein
VVTGLLLAFACGEGGGGAADTEVVATSEGPGGTVATEPGGGSSGDDPSADDGALPPPDCDAPQVPCGQSCTDLATDPQNCGECGRTCVIPNAEAGCLEGACVLATCDAGFTDCDGTVATGCEQAVECSEGSACQTTCGSTGSNDCGNVCEPVCAPPAEVCNVLDDDCDDVCDNGPVAGCRVGVHRSNGPSLGHFYTTSLAEATMGDLSLEFENFFYLYAGSVEGLQPLFRCIKGNGKYWMTTSTDCEGTAGPEQTMGFISPDDRCGATPLYRTRNPGPDAHFYTTSEAEKDNAVGVLGFVDEGIAGYIWVQP